MTPKADLSAHERHAFIAAFERAVKEIPSVRGVRIGRRVMTGANYESLSREIGDYMAIIDFDDRDGLDAYLRHPAHDALGARFYQTISSAMVFDYNVGGLELLKEI